LKAVICDFGGVLTTPLGNSFAAWSQESGISLEEVGRAMAASTERHRGEHPLFMLEKGQLDQAEFTRRLEEELEGDRRLDTIDVYLKQLERNSEMIAYMGELHDRGLRTALLTNNVREWEATWRAMLPEIDEIFEVVVDSAFVGMRKPERGIYELTVQRLGDGIAPSDCIFVDDMTLNCDAARELGMKAVIFETTEQARAEIEELLAR
jgi:epoxide hydrolase-like predicted phosphatase